jgi:DNA-binding PadR family transcriptional regulator
MRFGQKGFLRPFVLRILEDGPTNGIGIMDRMQEISRGWWRPSPGSIYPLLEQLAGEGMIKKRTDGKYELTSKYAHGAYAGGEADDALMNLEGSVSYLEELAESDKKKFALYKTRIKEIAKRLSELL